MFDRLLHMLYGVIILELPTFHRTLVSMHARNKLRLISILFEKGLFRNCYKFGLSLRKTKLADIFSKALPLPLFEECKRNLNMSPIVEIDGGTSMFVLGLY
jgi:hypothetical protein